MLVAVMLASLGQIALGCGACFRLPYESLLEKIEGWNRVVIAHPVDAYAAQWQIDDVIKGTGDDQQKLSRIDVVSANPKVLVGTQHILRWDEFAKQWSREAPAAQDVVRFLSGAVALSRSDAEAVSLRQQVQRNRYFLAYLEHADTYIADSAHAKLAKAPYEVLKKLAAELDRRKLLAWIDAQSAGVNRRVPLYVTLLGLRGDPLDEALIQQWIEQSAGGDDSGYLAAVLTAHIELRGEEAVRFLETSYLQNRARTLGEVIAAVDALRTHGHAQTSVSRKRITEGFHRLLRQRPQLAELVIDDFARWEDWSIAAKLIEIHAAGHQPWNNAQIIKYLEACPLPAAKRYVRQVSMEASANS